MRAKRTARTALEQHMASNAKKIAKLEAEIARLRADNASTKKLIDAYDAEHANETSDTAHAETVVQTALDVDARSTVIALLSQVEVPADEPHEEPEPQEVRRPSRTLQLGDLLRTLESDDEEPEQDEDDDVNDEEDDEHERYPYARSRRLSARPSWSDAQFTAAARSLGGAY